jgi:hypothetical protein
MEEGAMEEGATMGRTARVKPSRRDPTNLDELIESFATYEQYSRPTVMVEISLSSGSWWGVFVPRPA